MTRPSNKVGSEIILRDKQFCNLSEVVVRPTDTFETLLEKVELATILGTLQSMVDNFNFVSEEWTKNTQEERLLGVSLTGIYDNDVLSGKEGPEVLTRWLNTLRDYAREVNHAWADMLGIERSTAITCVDFCALQQ